MSCPPTLIVAWLALGPLGGSLGAPARAACEMQRRGEFPVTVSAMRALLKTQVNGLDKTFIIDSGSFFSFINPEQASELKLPLRAPPLGFGIEGIGGQQISYHIATVKDFTIYGVPLHDIDFVSGGTAVGSESGAAGLIGQNFLRSLGDVEYDFANGALRFWQIKGCSRDQVAYWVKGGGAYSMLSILPTTPAAPFTQGTAYVNGAPIHITLDTGSQMSVLSLRAAARAGVKPGNPDVKSAGYAMGLGRHRQETWIAPFARFKIGEEEIRNTHLRIGDIGSGTDMLLGFDFFLAHRVLVSNSQHQLFFSYSGGPIFNLSVQPPEAASPGAPATGTVPGAQEPEPADAAGYGRRAALRLAHRDYSHAITDLTRAIELDPHQPQYVHDRAKAYMGSHQAELARADLDRFLQLQPADVSALLERAQLRLDAHQQPAAIADLEAAGRAVSTQDNSRLDIGELYLSADRPQGAIEQFDLWLASHDQDARWPTGLFMRCRARALAGRDLDQALSDCNGSIRAFSGAEKASALETRGLVQLRRGELTKSIEDYSQALRMEPADAWALYGRGLAKARSGATAAGQADLAAARKVQPDIDEIFNRIGLAP